MKKTALTLMLGGILLAGSAVAHEAGSVVVRAGAITVDANSSSRTQTAIDVGLKVKNNTQLGLTGTYMLTDNIGVELLAATPFSHKIHANVPALNLDLGRTAIVKQLPPSLYAQYYFFKADSVVRPYLGAGLNYTRFYHTKSVHPAVTNLEVKKHSFGPVANVGIDVKLTQNVYFNVSAWYTHIKTTAKFQALGANHEVKLKLDPMVYFAGIAVKF